MGCHRAAGLAVALFACSSAAAGERGGSHPFDVEQLAGYPAELLVFVEIPAGSQTKYETDKQSGFVFVDRFLSAPVHYPTNYGSVPGTMMPDGDPLDALVITRAPLQAGVMIAVRPVGVMRMIDGDDVDDKLVAVPITKLDPSFDGITSVLDLPAIDREQIAAFFTSYKTLPKGRGAVEVPGFDGPEAVAALAGPARDAYATSQNGAHD